MCRIGLTGWEIFSKLDAVKLNLNQAEDISPRVFRLLQGPSIPESNQRGKRNKDHMNPLIQLKKATPLFVIALVLACFALSPQAFALSKVATPTFNPGSCSQHSKNVTISTTTSGASIVVSFGGQVGIMIPNGGMITLRNLGQVTIRALAYKHGMILSDLHSGTYSCP
jgi:hypothetical protein